MSAGGHLRKPGQSHGDHKGDFPALPVKRNGTTSARFTTDRLSLRSLRDKDGSAVMSHADRDDLAIIPEDRYSPDAGWMTRDTGDAGKPIACGTIASG